MAYAFCFGDEGDPNELSWEYDILDAEGMEFMFPYFATIWENMFWGIPKIIIFHMCPLFFL